MSDKNPLYVQKKIELIDKGLPIDVSETELEDLEKILRGARGFYIDIVQELYKHRNESGRDVRKFIMAENKNIVDTELALRRIDDFRESHREQIRSTA